MDDFPELEEADILAALHVKRRFQLVTVARHFQFAPRVCKAKLRWNELEASFYGARTGSVALRACFHP